MPRSPRQLLSGFSAGMKSGRRPPSQSKTSSVGTCTPPQRHAGPMRQTFGGLVPHGKTRGLLTEDGAVEHVRLRSTAAVETNSVLECFGCLINVEQSDLGQI